MQQLKRRHFLQGISGLILAAHTQEGWSCNRLPPLPPDATIAFGYSGSRNDEGWTACHELARRNLSRHFPGFKFIALDNIPYTISATRLLRFLITENVQMIFMDSCYDHFLQDVAKQTPAVSFLECNGNTVLPNLGCFYPAYWHVFYILGHTAALLSKTGKIGFINAFPISGSFANINATLLGARQANPSIQIQVFTTGSWFNPETTIQATETLCDNQCDILFNITNDHTHLQVAERRNVRAVLYNCPTPPIKSPAYVTTIHCDFEPFYKQQIQNRINGQWHADTTFLSFPDHCDYLPLGSTVPHDIQQGTDQFRSQFILNGKTLQGPIHDQNGMLRIPQGHTMQNNEIYQWNWFAKGIRQI